MTKITSSARRTPSPKQSRPVFLSRLARALRALDDHWLGDLLGVISLFGMLYLLLFIGWAVSP